MIDEAKIQEVLRRYNLPVPDGRLIHARHIITNQYWFVQNEDGWLWWDDLRHVWVSCPRGPEV